MTALHQVRLKHECFLEYQPLPSTLDVLPGSRSVHTLECTMDVRQVHVCAHRRWNRIRHHLIGIHRIKHDAYRGLDLPTRHGFRGRVDRDDRTREALDLLGIRAVPEQDILRVRQLPLFSVTADGPREQAPLPHAQLTLTPGLIEERDDERVGAVTDEDFQERAALVAHPSGRDRGDVRHDRHVIAVGEP